LRDILHAGKFTHCKKLGAGVGCCAAPHPFAQYRGITGNFSETWQNRSLLPFVPGTSAITLD
jgi:hypothetical protein